MKKSRQTTAKRPIWVLVTTSVLVAFLCASTMIFSVSANDEAILHETATPKLQEQALESVPLFLKEAVNLDEAKVTGIDILREEDLYSFTTINEDGTKTLYSFTTPIKYKDESGEMKYIDNNLVPSAKGADKNDTYAFENKDSDTKTYFPKTISEGILVTHKDYSIEFNPLPCKSAVESFNNLSPVKTLKEETTVYTQYDDVFGKGYTLQYAPKNGGIKENIVIDEYTGINTFSFEITAPGLKPELIDGQSIEFLDVKGEIIFTVGQTFVADSYEGKNDGNRHITFNNYYTIEETGDGVYLLTSIVDKEFLENPNTVYPILVDPTIYVDRANMEDCTVFDGGGYPDNTHLTVGTLNSTEYMSFVRLTNMQNYTYINTENIISANYCARMVYPTNTESVTISIFDAFNTYDKTIQQICNLGIDGLTLCKYGSAVLIKTLGAPSVPTDPTFYLNITSLAKMWIKAELGESGGYTQLYGFILEAANQTTCKQFKSSKWGDTASYFNMTYTEDTSIATGVYLIKNVGTGKYLYVAPSVPVSGSNVVVHPFNGITHQQWSVNHISDGEYRLDSVIDTDLVLNNSSLNATVVTKGSTASAQKWRLVENNDGSGTYRIFSKYNPHYCVKSGSALNIVTDDANLGLYTGASSQKWVLEKATSYGGANAYINETRSGIRCYAYAFRFNILDLNVAGYNQGDSLDTTKNKVISDVSSKGRHIRVVGKDDLIHPTREYKVAMRTCSTDYHFMFQLNNGGWAHKLSYLNSENLGSINPSTYPWDWTNIGGNHYDSSTIYFAVEVA